MKLLTSRLRKQASVALAALIFVSSAQAATLFSSVNRNQINSNQTLTLTVKYDKQVAGSALNIGALNTDFEVLSITPHSSSSTSYVNGSLTKTESTAWKITLAAKRKGQLTIPAFEINGDESSAITVQVQEGSSNSNTNSELTVTVSADSGSVYESQQILLEVELAAAQGLSGFNGSKFDIQNAQITELGQRNEQRVDNGIVRNIFILSYAVFPEKAGKLSIPSLSFTAIKGRQRSFFGDTGGEKVIARSTPFEIDVKPADKTHSPWFTATDVELKSQWSGDTTSVIAGEPITRTLTVLALGQQASAIPPLVRGNEDGFKSYKDQAQLETKETVKGYLSSRIESEAIVVSTPGQLTLPAISFKWWNVNTSAWQEATVPEQTLTVLPSSNKPQGPINTANNATPQTSLGGNEPQGKSHWLWPFISGLLLVICLVQSYFLWTLSKREKNKPSKVQGNINESESSAWSNLNKSFKKNDSASIRQALGGWAQTLSPSNEYISLNALANYSSNDELNSQLKKTITELETGLYKEQSTFDSSALKQQVTALRKLLKTKPRSDKTLNPLYKN